MRTTIYNGITAEGMLRRCGLDVATVAEREILSYTAAMMHACEDISEDQLMAAAHVARQVDGKLIAQWQGVVRLNRNGQPFGGVHPALVGF